MTQTVPAIVRAAEQRDVLTAALAYEHMGLSVLACNRDKSPAVHSWRHLTTRRARVETVEAWERAGLLASVGIICGAVSGGLVVVDCDGEDAVQTFRRAFPRLADTFSVQSGSGQGEHFYLLANDVPATARVVGAAFGNIEMRSNGAYVIAPPSVHPTGQRYTVHQDYEIRWVNNLIGLRNWIHGQILEKHGGNMPAPNTAQPVVNADAYARAALIIQADRVRDARAGARNNQLNLSAFSLGRFIRDGRLSREEVINALEIAAAHLVETDGIASVRRTINSGISAGAMKYEMGK